MKMVDEGENADWIKKANPKAAQEELEIHKRLAEKYNRKKRLADRVGKKLAEVDSATTKGGENSGHHGHAGRPGLRGGSAPSGGAADMSIGIARRLRQKLLKDGGFTYHAVRGDYPSEGFVVGVFSERSRKFRATEFKAEDIEKYTEDNADVLKSSQYHVGAWYNTEDGNIYLDVSARYKTPQEGVAVGMYKKEIAIYDLGRGKEINLSRLQDYPEYDFTGWEDLSPEELTAIKQKRRVNNDRK